jgi:hypothetical protein
VLLLFLINVSFVSGNNILILINFVGNVAPIVTALMKNRDYLYEIFPGT